MEGWISLHRKFLNWEWYDDKNMVKFFIHLLLNANYKPNIWRGVNIDRGQLLTGRKKLSKDLKMTEQEVRTCLSRLKSTQEIRIKTTNKYSIITVCNYDSYQDKEKENNQQTTIQTPTNNQQLTTNNKENNSNKEINIFFIEFKKITKKRIRVIDDKTKRQFNARIKEGYSLRDIIKATENCFNDKYHQENPKYLTMEFITRSDKLQKYLNSDNNHSLESDKELPSHLQNMVY